MEAGGPNRPITLWDYVPGYKGDSGTSRYGASQISLPRPFTLSLFSSLSPSLPLSPFCLQLHLSDARLSFLFKCTPHWRWWLQQIQSMIHGSTIPSAKDHPWKGQGCKGSRRTTGDADETSAIVPVCFFVARVTFHDRSCRYISVF